MESDDFDHIVCKNPDCKKTGLQQNNILRHLKAKNCRSFYTDEEIELIRDKSKIMAKKLDAERKRKFYDKDKKLQKEKKHYDPEKRAKKYQRKKRADQDMMNRRISYFRKECHLALSSPVFVVTETYSRGVLGHSRMVAN